MDTDTTITDDIINGALQDGKTNAVIAAEMGVHPTTVGRWRKPNQGTAEKQFAIAALRAEGVKTPVIAQVLGLKEKTVYGIEYGARKSGNNPLLLPKRIKSAVKFVDKLRAGEPFGTIEKVKDSTALAANAMILDRAYPRVSDNQGPSISFTQINISVLESGSETHKTAEIDSLIAQ